MLKSLPDFAGRQPKTKTTDRSELLIKPPENKLAGFPQDCWNAGQKPLQDVGNLGGNHPASDGSIDKEARWLVRG